MTKNVKERITADKRWSTKFRKQEIDKQVIMKI